MKYPFSNFQTIPYEFGSKEYDACVVIHANLLKEFNDTHGRDALIARIQSDTYYHLHFMGYQPTTWLTEKVKGS
jgi:hypothetical protein